MACSRDKDSVTVFSSDVLIFFVFENPCYHIELAGSHGYAREACFGRTVCRCVGLKVTVAVSVCSTHGRRSSTEEALRAGGRGRTASVRRRGENVQHAKIK